MLDFNMTLVYFLSNLVHLINYLKKPDSHPLTDH